MLIVLRKFVEWWQRQVRSGREQLSSRERACRFDGEILQAQHQLIRLLELAASYNDKGIFWRNDSPAQVQQTRQEWQREIDTLIPLIGESNLPFELLAALRSGGHCATIRAGSSNTRVAGCLHAADRLAVRPWQRPSPRLR